MIRFLGVLLRSGLAAFQTRRELALENLALRQQLSVLQATRRPLLTNVDRVFWAILRGRWSHWKRALVIVQPETVVRWHRQGFKLYWRWKSRNGGGGRPKIDPDTRALVRRMSLANPFWGAPRIHGELLKLGIEISQTTVAKYMPRSRRPPSQSWRAFLDNHLKGLVSIDFFTVPSATFHVLFVLVVLATTAGASFTSTSPSIPTRSGLLSRWLKRFLGTRHRATCCEIAMRFSGIASGRVWLGLASPRWS